MSVTMQDAHIAACLTDSVMCRLQNYVTNYRTNKARQDFEFQKGLFERKKKEYEIKIFSGGFNAKRYLAFRERFFVLQEIF